MQVRISARLALAAAAAIVAAPAALAQDEAENGATTQYATAEREDEGRFPWGLLGLLGLAGLLGANKRERDIHVDARRNP